MASSCTNLKPQNNLSLNSVTNNKAYMTAEEPERPINAQRYEEILVPLGSVMMPGRTIVDEHFNQSYLQHQSIAMGAAFKTTTTPRMILDNNTSISGASDMRASQLSATRSNVVDNNKVRLNAAQRLLELE